MRDKVILECTECKSRNYTTKKNKKLHPDRVETNKYCKFCTQGNKIGGAYGSEKCAKF